MKYLSKLMFFMSLLATTLMISGCNGSDNISKRSQSGQAQQDLTSPNKDHK